jgi:uncharacterized membrane protein
MLERHLDDERNKLPRATLSEKEVLPWPIHRKPEVFRFLRVSCLDLALAVFLMALFFIKSCNGIIWSPAPVYPADSLANLKFNVMLDGLFHASTYIFTVIGLIILWHSARKPHFRWSAKLLFAAMLIGFGAFNLVEGIINHHLLELHHVNETVPRDQWIYWDIGFLIWGAAMLIAGLLLYRNGKRDSIREV